MTDLHPDVRALQRVVFPAEGSHARALYVDEASSGAQVTGRRSCRVAAGTTLSLAAYFNAFPAAYWRTWTTVDEVELVAELSGPATVVLFGSDAAGRARRIDERRAGPDGRVQVRAGLTDFIDGGWLWCDVVADDADVELTSACWRVPDEDAAPSVSASLGITTFNRVDSCVAVLQQIADDDALGAVVDRVYVVDQGDQPIRSSDAFPDVASVLRDRLTVIEQPNLGGSGGFARCQLETLRAKESDHLVILDDDIVLEPEAVRRAVEFAARCRTPSLVGAHMFSLPEPTRLHAMAECVDVRRFRWGPKHEDQREHDLAAEGLRSTPWLHRREDVNYNGWWMCLIPRQVLESVGLSLPFFIRWDDAEFGLRAGGAGFPTVTLPGVAVWHVPWTHKTDALDWQAYFHQRNRVIAALLHSPYPHGGLLVPELLMHQVKHLASMQYSTAELRLRAVADVLAGPYGLHAALTTKTDEARRVQAAFPDADVRPAGELPAAPDARARRESSRAGRWAWAGVGVARQLLPAPSERRRTPQVRLDAAQAHWSQLLKYDSAVVSTADGRGAVWYRRDRRMFADIARRSVAMHRRLRQEWPRLASEYRGALAEIASPATWHDTFESVRKGG